MLRLPLTALSIVCLILLSCWSIWRSTVAPLFAPPALVAPAATVRAAATVTAAPAAARPDATATLIPLLVRTGTASLPPFQLVLPSGWQYVNLPHSQVVAQWPVGAPTQLINDRALLPQEMTFIVAWSLTKTVDSGIIAYTAPRQDLTLEQYVADSAAKLGEQTGVTVDQTEVSYTLHDEVPVAFLHYTLPPGANGQESQASAGYQVLLFDKLAENLLLLTYITPVHEQTLTNALAGNADQPVPAELQSIIRAVER